MVFQDLDTHGVGKSSAKGYSLRGSSNFNSTTGVTISHSLGHTDYMIDVTPTVNPGGYLGEVWVEKTTTGFTVYCSGTFTGAFDYILFE